MEPERSQNPYRTPESDVAGDAAIPIEHIAAFAHEPLNTRSSLAYYTQKWRSSPHSWFMGLNWPALLFSTLWCFYRKQYVLGLGLMVATSIATWLLGAGMRVAGARDTSIALAGFVLPLLISLVFGFLANRLYLEAAAAAARRARLRYADPQDVARYLERAGGTSLLSLAIGFGCILGFSLLEQLALGLLSR